MTRIAVAVLTLIVAAPAVAQVDAPLGTTPPPGMGMGNAMASHDGAYTSVADQTDRARFDSANATHGRRDRATAATPADLVANAAVFDPLGRQLGMIDRVDGTGVVVASTGGRVAVPANAFGKTAHGLMLALSKDDFDRLVAGATK